MTEVTNYLKVVDALTTAVTNKTDKLGVNLECATGEPVEHGATLIVRGGDLEPAETLVKPG